LRDNYVRIQKKGCIVLGISTNSAESHRKFSCELKLPFDLLTDAKKEAHRAYGIPWMGRGLILIDSKGFMRLAIRQYRFSAETWQAVFAAVERL